MSRLFVIGLSHRTAPIEIREALAVSDDTVQSKLLEAARLCGEAMLLSTCNRFELYGSIPDGMADAAALSAIQELLTATRPPARDHLYSHVGEVAVRHLFRVTASLDSMVLGEPQILGQVKQAYALAQSVGTVGGVLSSTVPRAFQVAKRVRSETAIGQNSASVASVAVSLASQIFGQLRGQPVLLVGAGKMAELCARHLREAEADQFLIVNRTRSRAEDMAARLSGTAHEFHELESLLGRAAVVICSTGAREPVLRKELLAKVMKARRGRWLLLIDIAVPRDIEPQVGELDNVYLYDIDALQAVVSGNLSERQREATTAEQIVASELSRFQSRERQEDVVPVIKALRSYAQGIAQAELNKLLPRMPALAERDRKLVMQLCDSIVNKLLHAPLTALKRSASGGDDPQSQLDLAEAVRRLFPLQLPAPQEAREGGASPEPLPLSPEQAVATTERRATPPTETEPT